MNRCVGKISQKPSLHCQLRCFGYTQHSVVSFLWWVRELKSPTTAPSREPETVCTGPDSLSPEVALRNLPACNFQQFCNWLSYKMGFLQKQLAVPSPGIHFSIYAQNWVLKKNPSCGQTTAQHSISFWHGNVTLPAPINLAVNVHGLFSHDLLSS